MKTSELTGAALDWAVTKCEGIESRNNWIVQYIPHWAESDDPFVFECFADDAVHAVEQCEDAYPDCTVVDYEELPGYCPSTNWAQGGPIIEREDISVSREFSSGKVEWAAWTPAPIRDDAEAFGYGPTPLIAAMRCYVASKLGDTIEAPERLTA